MTSNAHLLPPEIIQEIVSLTGNREQLDLAYTCKHFFSSIIPVIWGKIRGVCLIIQLIPGVGIVKEYVEDENGTVTSTLLHILIDESSLAEDWTRYWIYAPLVKHIVPFVSDERSHGDNLHVHGWRFLFMGLTGNPLLPNLLSVDTRRQNLSPWFDQLAWISLFISPSLQEFYLGDVAWDEGSYDLPIRPFDLLLGQISRIPSSNPSEIKPRRAEWHPSEDELVLLCENEYWAGFHRFNDVSAPVNIQYLEIHLSTLTNVLWDELYVLGCLPVLKGLHIRFPKVETRIEYKDPFPSNLFASLEKLYLITIPNVDMFRWIWELKPLVSGLLSVQIRGWRVCFFRGVFISTIVQLLQNNSPALMDLDLDLTDARDVGLLDAACELLSAIPLKALYLDGTDTGYFTTTQSQNNFPHLRRLRLGAKSYTAACGNFPKIAKVFPNLEYLCINPGVLNYFNPQDLSDTNIEYTALQLIEINIPGFRLPKRGAKRERNSIRWVWQLAASANALLLPSVVLITSLLLSQFLVIHMA